MRDLVMKSVLECSHLWPVAHESYQSNSDLPSAPACCLTLDGISAGQGKTERCCRSRGRIQMRSVVYWRTWFPCDFKVVARCLVQFIRAQLQHSSKLCKEYCFMCAQETRKEQTSSEAYSVHQAHKTLPSVYNTFDLTPTKGTSPRYHVT